MEKTSRGFVRTLIIAFAVMMVVPVAYRVWTGFRPPQVRQVSPLDVLNAWMDEERPLRLLTLPLANWTEADRKDEPKLLGWLQAHAQTVLPWEWSAEARTKDVSGYLASWRDVLQAETKSMERSLKSLEKERRQISAEAERAWKLHGHVTNQMALAEAELTAKTLPTTLTVEDLSKGRFWGWNRRQRQVELRGEADRAAFFADLAKQRDEHLKAIGSRTSEIAVRSAAIDAASKVLSELKACGGELDGLEEAEERAKRLQALVPKAERCLLRCIR